MNPYLTEIAWMVLALVLSTLIGLERQIRGKSAGIRTQAIVGLTAALMVLVSKYGFQDVLADGITRFDPSRVASQIVSGIGFLGAGIILTRHGAIRGLTTAATIWETAAVGMACGAGLWWLAVAGTALHFLIVLVMSELLQQVGALGWQVHRLSSHADGKDSPTVARLVVSTAQPLATSALVASLVDLEGVLGVEVVEDDEE